MRSLRPILRGASVLLIVALALFYAPQNPKASADYATIQSVSSPASASPCLAPSAADTSTGRVAPAGTSARLSGHVPSTITKGKATYQGELPPTQLIRIELVFGLRNPQTFEACLASIEDPQSPNYGHFLNATTLSPYLPTPGQKASVISYLAQRGFNVTDGASPLVVYLTANAGTVEKAFGVNLRLYGVNSNSSFYAPDSDPVLPQNYAAMVTYVSGLENYTTVRPSLSAPGPCNTSYCPQGIQVGYALSSLYTGGFDGTGKSVAVIVVPGDPDAQAAIATFSTQFGLPATTLDIRYPNCPDPLVSCLTSSDYDPTWASETAMDIEAVHAVAPGANIVLLYCQTEVLDCIDYAAAEGIASVASNSWVYCTDDQCTQLRDVDFSPSFLTSVDTRLAVDAAQGLTILFASGDWGAYPDGGLAPPGVDFPASDPNVLAVGATKLVLTGCTATTCTGYGSENGASISGGGYSGVFSEPSWQASTIGARAGRAVPDVSMLGHLPYVWVYSTLSDQCGSSLPTANQWFRCSGTSLSTPLWAGFLAVVLQMRGANFGNIGPLIYQLGASPTYNSNFHDITSGSNGYPATVGWDNVTGWGTPIANQLAPSLAGTTEVLTTAVTSGLGSVSPNCPTPSGCVELVGGSVTVTAIADSSWQFSGWSTQVGVQCFSNPCTFTMPNMPVTLEATFISTFQVGQIVSDVFSASADSAWLGMPDYTFGFLGQTHTSATKCHGGPAQVSDIYATYALIGALSSEQNEILDTNSAFVSQSTCGQPLTSSTQPFVSIAGPSVNQVTYYYGAMSSTGQSQLWWDSGSNCIRRRDTGASVLCNPSLTATQDYFVIEAFKDSTGRNVYLIWGWGWLGTVASADFISETVAKNPSTFTRSWYVFRWNDATSGTGANNVPDAKDSFTELASGP